MDIEPVKSTRIYEEIVRQIKQLIADGKLKSGIGSRRSATSPRSSW